MSERGSQKPACSASLHGSLVVSAFPVAAQEAAGCPIDEFAATETALPQGGFALHAEFRHHAQRGGVSGVGEGLDSV